MKVFVSILFFIVLATFCKGETKQLPDTSASKHSQYTSTPVNNFAVVFSEEIFVDEQDSSEKDVFENCFFQAIPRVRFILLFNHFRVETNNLPFQNPINSFFIDLPPPMLS